MLTIKIAGATNVQEGSPDELHVSAFIQTRKARHLASARTRSVTRNGSVAFWNEEVLLPVSNEDAPSASSVVLELRGGGGSETGGLTTQGIVGYAKIEWEQVKSNTTEHGWGISQQLLSASGEVLYHTKAVKLTARFLFSSTVLACGPSAPPSRAGSEAVQLS